MHHRDTETSSDSGFVPKSHAAILLLSSGAYTFLDRQGVSFSVTPSANNLPYYLPVSVTKMVTSVGAGAIFLA
jgi:ABC-type enterochelin transport system substrate-binding protein